MFRDLEQTLNEINLKNDKIDFPSFTSQVSVMLGETKNAVCRLENKYKELVESIETKFNIWKLEAISKISNGINPDTNIINKCDCENLTKKCEAQENEISLLQAELTAKNKSIVGLQKEITVLTCEAKNHSGVMLKEIDEVKRERALNEEKISSLQTAIAKLQLQINTLNGQNNILAISIRDKDVVINKNHLEIRDLGQRLGKCDGEIIRLEEALAILRNIHSQIQFLGSPNSKCVRRSDIFEDNSPEFIPPCEDVFIIHDSLFKNITEGLMKNKKISVRRIWAPKMYYALDIVKNMTETPKVVFIHTSTNDLEEVDDEQIISDVNEIYTILNGKGIKFVWSNILPRKDNLILNAKAELINAKIGVFLRGKVDAYISRNDNFYLRDIINPAFFNDDGVHVYENGIKQLARNTRAALCRSLDIEFVSAKPKRNFGKGRYK